MKIHFGLHLDGQHCRKLSTMLGEITVGPLGLLNILETQLGLLHVDVGTAARVAAYRHYLKQCDTPGRFYHRTFESDELGTAATLLAWRDAWYLQGWDGSFSSSVSPRLKDIGDVEAVAKRHLAPSTGERLEAVLQALEECCPAIQALCLYDPLDAFPARWQAVLRKLPVTPCSDLSEVVVGKGFLGEVQQALLASQNGKAQKKLTWRSDGTITVVQAETELVAGQWLADLVGKKGKSGLIVATDKGVQLDSLLAAADRPRQGFGEVSTFRPALQVLPLALGLLWEPLNLYGLLVFLTHPIGPLPRYASMKLAETLANKPGLGGEDWTDALENIAKHYSKTDKDLAHAVREKILFWVEHQRYLPDAGAPLASVIEKVERLQVFFRKRLADANPATRSAYMAGFAQCSDFGAALCELARQGFATISPAQLQKLIAQATGNGSANPMLEAEVGAQLGITHPAAAIDPCDWVVWWPLAMPRLPADHPWSQNELAELAQHGTVLPDMADKLERTAREWLRPILCAREELILVLPPKGEEAHPLWLMLESLIEQPLVLSLESVFQEPNDGMVPVPHEPLPARRRWWTLPSGLAGLECKKASFSSLELFLFNPYHWLLKYPAALRSSRILTISDDFRLYGNLAHALVEDFYRRPDALQMPDDAFETWFDLSFEPLIAEQGAVLLMPGRRADLENFRIRLNRAVHELRICIANIGATNVVPEQVLSGHFVGGELSGFADLVLGMPDGSHAIIDMKLAGRKKYAQKLVDNRHLQLTLYGEMLRQQNGAWPSLAYYILNDALLLATDTTRFPSAQLVVGRTDEGTPELWQRFLKTWKWRKDQLDRGRIELVLEDIPATDESVSPDDGLEVETLNSAYNEYLALAGWEE